MLKKYGNSTATGSTWKTLMVAEKNFLELNSLCLVENVAEGQVFPKEVEGNTKRVGV